MEICNLPDKGFKIAVLRKLNELQEHADNFNEIRKTIYEQNKKFSKNIKEITKKEPNKFWS